MKKLLLLSLTCALGINSIKISPLLDDKGAINFDNINKELSNIRIKNQQANQNNLKSNPKPSENEYNRNINANNKNNTNQPAKPDQKEEKNKSQTTDNTKPLEFEKGKDFEINIEGNPTTGYSWYLRKDESANKVASALNLNQYNTTDDYKQEKNADGYVGGPDVFHFKFKGLEKGTAKLNFDYKRPWETEPIENKVYTVEISQK